MRKTLRLAASFALAGVILAVLLLLDGLQRLADRRSERQLMDTPGRDDFHPTGDWP